MQTPISKNLAKLLAAKGISQTELSKATGVGQSTISRILKPDGPKGIQEPTERQVRPLAQFFDITTDQLRGHTPLPDNTESSANIEKGPDISGRVPLISWVQAGAWCEIDEGYPAGASEEWIMCPTAYGPKAFALRVRGESMFDPTGRKSFKDGDIIFIDPDRCADNGSLVVCKLVDSEEATFKQLVIEGSERYLKALNPSWPERIIKINGNAAICGVVIGKFEPF